jgi:hypothetical protein
LGVFSGKKLSQEVVEVKPEKIPCASGIKDKKEI